MIRVCFCVRNDFFDKFGGDTFQIKNYIRFAPSNYCASTVTFDDFKFDIEQHINKNDIFILTNIDRSYEFLGFYRLLKNKVNPSTIIILPIHHSILSIQNFYRSNYSYIWPIMRILGGVFFIEKLKTIFHIVSAKKLLLNSLFRFSRTNYKEETRGALCNSGGIICIAEGEALSICKDFNLKALNRCFIVRNGVNIPLTLPKKNIKDREIDVLVCGRIEKRKNQLNIAKTLSGTGLKVCFIGSPNKNNNGYFKKFLTEISTSKNLDYAGVVDPGEIHQFYLSSKIHLSASWFEVSSLVDIEAYSYGCHVVSSINGYSNEMIKEDVITLINPSNLTGLNSLLTHIINNIKQKPYNIPIDQSNLHTWKESSKNFFTHIDDICKEIH